MKPFPEDPEFTPGEKGFDDKDESGRPYDLLGRKALGQRLTDLLDRVEQPLVVALDGGWGSGKSHFLKLWTGAHTKELGGEAKVIYFDAFEHDYLDDPLISLVARLTTNDAEQTWGKTAIKAVKRAAMPLAKLGLRIGAAVATAGLTEVVGPVADAAVAKAGEATQASVDAFWKREANRISAMKEFRDALTALTVPATVGEPPQKIVFIIDELDRCRPDYALMLLEIIKHFFAVPNVHFVLGTSINALENSVRARYGSDIQAYEYLMKFIHLRMALPVARDFGGNGEWAGYFDKLTSELGLGAQSANCLRNTLSLFGQFTAISLRDVQRVAGRAMLFPKEVETYSSAYINLTMSALVMQVLAPRHYMRLRRGSLVINDVLQLFPDPPINPKNAHFAAILNHLWRRVLMDDPGEETKRFTASAFGPFGDRIDRDHFEKLWADLFDVFQVPAG